MTSPATELESGMTEHNWIAEQQFRCISVDGKIFPLTLRISEPIEVETEAGSQPHARCRISLEPIAADRWGPGQNKFQALCLSLDYVRTVFKVFLAEGGRIYWEETDSPIDIQSPWFAPLPSLAELGGRNVPGDLS